MTANEQISHLAGVPVDIRVELQTRKMTVAEILSLEPGSVISTSRAAGENIDVLVGGQLIGSGEIIVVENATAVRLSDFRERI